MSKPQQNYWEEIINRYKVTGLSQVAFCKQNNISINQFQYRWYEHNKALKVQAPQELFESVSVLPKHVPPVAASTMTMNIHLPNQIRCEIKIGDCHNELTYVLRQLVALC